jgi:hypothetical protein
MIAWKLKILPGRESTGSDWRKSFSRQAGSASSVKALSPSLPRMLQRGELFGHRVRLRQGDPHRCHANAAGLWARDIDRLQLVSGYASRDDLWVAHSWVLEGKTLLETTCKFERYFGFLLTPIEAHKFFFENVIDHEFPDASAIPESFWEARPGLWSLTEEVMTGMDTFRDMFRQRLQSALDGRVGSRPSRQPRSPGSLKRILFVDPATPCAMRIPNELR